MFSIFHIEGVIGKNISATAVIESLKKSDSEREIIIVSDWPQVWFNIYKNYIKDKDTKMFRIDPHHTEDYMLNKKTI